MEVVFSTCVVMSLNYKYLTMFHNIQGKINYKT